MTETALRREMLLAALVAARRDRLGSSSESGADDYSFTCAASSTGSLERHIMMGSSEVTAKPAILSVLSA